MTRLVHLSDLHFGAIDLQTVAAVTDEIRADPPDLCIISGDLTLRARTREYLDAKAFIDGLGCAVLAVPGNHDVAALDLFQRFTDPFKRWRQHIHPKTQPTWCDEEVAVVGLNTARRWSYTLNWADGRFGREQIAKVTQEMAKMRPELVRIVVAHHPLMPPEGMPDLPIVGRSRLALRAFSQAGVRMVLSGHLHRSYTRRSEAPIVPAEEEGAERVVEARPAQRVPPILLVQASTATSTRLRDEPNGYNRITVEKGEIRIESRVWTGTGFVTAEPLPLTQEQRPPDPIASPAR